MRLYSPVEVLAGIANPQAVQVLELRDRLQLTQEQLAQAIGVSFSTVNRWERGHCVPSPRYLSRISQLQRQTGPGPKPAAVGRAGMIGSGLPFPVTTFVGRDGELEDLRQELACRRVVTLTGPPGVGKTRLALELARRAVGPDEAVAFVGLEAVTNPSDMPVAFQVALGLRDLPGSGPTDLIVKRLASGPHLLVVDNCEHLVPALRPFLSTLLAAAEGLRVLATSRASLGIAAEQVWLVPPMRLDAETGGSEAVRLFVARAREVAPGFDAEGASGVDRLCRQLDGLALALEMAAGWMVMMGPDEMADRLEGNLDLLESERVGSDRHRTLRAAIEWSDSLLAPADRELLARISVCAGTFTLDDAEAVAGERSRVDVLQSVRRLIDSSWLTLVPGLPLAGYRMLESLRSYAGELLDRSGERRAISAAHAAHLCDLATRAEAGLQGPDRSRWLVHLAAVSDNLHAVLEWCLTDDGEPAVGATLAVALLHWWHRSGRLVAGRTWLERFRTGPSLPVELRARVLVAEATLASLTGDYDTAAALAVDGLTALDDDQAWSQRAHTVLGATAKNRGDFESANQHFGFALAAARAVADEGQIAAALNNLGTLATATRDYAASARYFEESLAFKRRSDDKRSLALTLNNLSDALLHLDQPARAEPLLDEARSIVGGDGDVLNVAIDINLGDARHRVGDFAGATRYFESAAHLARETSLAAYEALAMCHWGRALDAMGNPAAGIRLVRQAYDQAMELGDEEVLAEARLALDSIGVPADSAPRIGGLTKREVEVLRLLADGKSNPEIAAALFLSRGTVDRHTANIYTKIGVNSRVEATRYALAHGIA